MAGGAAIAGCGAVMRTPSRARLEMRITTRVYERRPAYEPIAGCGRCEVGEDGRRNVEFDSSPFILCAEQHVVRWDPPHPTWQAFLELDVGHATSGGQALGSWAGGAGGAALRPCRSPSG